MDELISPQKTNKQTKRCQRLCSLNAIKIFNAPTHLERRVTNFGQTAEMH